MRSGAFFWVGAIGASLVVASCAIVGYDLDGYGPAKSTASTGGGGGQGGSGGGTSSTGAGASCGAARTCAETPPDGWQGPVAVLEDQPAGACAGEFPNLVFSGGRAPHGDPATCSGCTCDTAACNANSFISAYPSAGCTGTPLTYAISMTCGSVSPVGTTFVSVTNPVAGGTCNPVGGSVDVPAAAFGARLVACGGVQLGESCGAGGRCAPAPKPPFASGLCIFREGDHACPAGLTKQVYFDTLNDTRACTACTCGAPAPSCSVAVTFAVDTICSQSVGTAIGGAGCTTLAAPWNSAIAKVGSPCAPVQGQPTGDVTGSGATTFCCE